MTGAELREIRLRMGIPEVEFGLLVLQNKGGNLSTVRRWVVRLEAEDLIQEKTAQKVRAYYSRWLTHGHDDDAMDAAYEKAKGARKRARRLGRASKPRPARPQ